MIVLDINVVSKSMRPDPSPSVLDWVVGQAALTCTSTPPVKLG